MDGEQVEGGEQWKVAGGGMGGGTVVGMKKFLNKF